MPPYLKGFVVRRGRGSSGQYWPQARSDEDTGDSRDKQDDEARCSVDTCGTRGAGEGGCDALLLAPIAPLAAARNVHRRRHVSHDRRGGGGGVHSLRDRICHTLRAPSKKAIHTIRVDEKRLE
jgi:hypothetical protein